MKSIAIIICLALAVGATPAMAASPRDVSIETWIKAITQKLGFQNGILDRESYGERTDAFIQKQATYYRSVHSQYLEEEDRYPQRSHEATKRIERMIARSTKYARQTEENIFDTLGNGGLVIEEKAARKILADIAAFADIDKNGRLDKWEAQIAEATIARGQDIHEPGAWEKMSRLIAWDNVRY